MKNYKVVITFSEEEIELLENLTDLEIRDDEIGIDEISCEDSIHIILQHL